jgi:PPOX class probable F420-dependent enzyme
LNNSPTAPLSQYDQQYLDRHRIAHLATVDASGRPHAIPVCFVVVVGSIFVPIDTKPKRVGATELKRVRNILERPNVALVVDDYDENWEKLSYLMVRGVAELRQPDAPEHAAVVALLRSKYPQYVAMPLDAGPTIQITPSSVSRWAWHGWPPS